MVVILPRGAQLGHSEETGVFGCDDGREGGWSGRRSVKSIGCPTARSASVHLGINEGDCWSQHIKHLCALPPLISRTSRTSQSISERCSGPKIFGMEADLEYAPPTFSD